MRCVQLGFAAVQLRPHPPSSLRRRSAKRARFTINVISVEHGLSNLLAQEPRLTVKSKPIGWGNQTGLVK
jgi:hypothetical protein